jgi:hypothetical protein
MPTWSQPPKNVLQTALSSVCESLENEIAEDPSFEEITGLPVSALAENAVDAVSAFITRDETPGPLDPNAWIQIYALGFIVGMRYGETRAT